MHSLDNDIAFCVAIDLAAADQLALEPDFDGEGVKEGVVND